MRRILFATVALALTCQYAWANQTSLRAKRSERRRQLGIKPMDRSNVFRWSVLGQRNISYSQTKNWTVKTLGFDAAGNTVVKAVNKKSRESFFATAKKTGWNFDVKEVSKPAGLVRVLHTNAYRKAFIKVSGVNTPTPWWRSQVAMTTIAVTAKGESIMAVTAPRSANFKTNQVVVRGSYTTNAAGKITKVKAEILTDPQLQALGLFTHQEQKLLVGESSKSAVYREVNGQVRAPYGVRGRRKSARFRQYADKTVVKPLYGDRVKILPKGHRIDRWIHLLTGQETAQNKRPIFMTHSDVAAAHAQIFGQ